MSINQIADDRVRPHILFSGIPVSDCVAALDWYSRTFGRDPDLMANDDEVLWQIVGPAWIYVVRDEARAGRSLVNLAVADLDRLIDELAGRGIIAGPVEEVGAVGTKAPCTDPAGNRITFVEVHET
jgi:predicted enzyme related to lactoylglutathione lyase